MPVIIIDPLATPQVEDVVVAVGVGPFVLVMFTKANAIQPVASFTDTV